MTKKRFTMKGSTILECEEEITAWDCCDLLNELSDENKQLKQQLIDVTKSIDSLCNRVDKVNRSNEFKWGAIMGLRTLQRELKGDME